MKLNTFKLVVSIASVSSLGLLSACATTPPAAPVAPVAVVAEDVSQPTIPVAAPALVVETPKTAPNEPEPLPARGSVASVVKKMETSPYTLYWRDNNTYSYYIGGLLDAEYKPGTGLIVQDAVGDVSNVVCQFDAAGKLSAKNGKIDPKLNDACSQLMFTLDDELSD